MRCHLEFSVRAWLLATALFGGLLVPAAPTAAEPPRAERPTDYAVVANYLAAFCRYVNWPALPAGAPADTPLRIGVLGPNPFGATLDKTLAGRSLRGRPLVAVYATGPEQLADCQLVLITLADEKARTAAAATFAQRPVLTAVYLGEATEPAPTGATLELVRTGNNVRYWLDADVLASQGLQATPGLLENALRRRGGTTR